MAELPSHTTVAIVGGGQAGLSMSAELKARGIAHVVLEKHRVAHAWRTQRWDSFCLVTPNWQCKLPGFGYAGSEPHGFMKRDDIVAYVEAFARHIEAPIFEGVAVTKVARAPEGGVVLETSAGRIAADAVVLAVSGYHRPKVPRIAERLPATVTQIHSSGYRNPAQLPAGEVMVVGSGQSGCQIAEDLHLAGRRVHLVTGSAPRCPRFYRGRDAVDWLAELGQYDMPVTKHPQGTAVRRNANHYMTGRDGGRDIDLRLFASQGMQLYGRLEDVRDGVVQFRDDLARNLDGADTVYNGICGLIDRYIADKQIEAPEGRHYRPVWSPGTPATQVDVTASDIRSVIWATGFSADWSWVDLPIFDGAGYPSHTRGVTTMPEVYVLGLPWLNTWGSGRFEAVGADAAYLAGEIAAQSVSDRLRVVVRGLEVVPS